jgi:formate/nitrite transporter FocA (FNT family)
MGIVWPTVDFVLPTYGHCLANLWILFLFSQAVDSFSTLRALFGQTAGIVWSTCRHCLAKLWAMIWQHMAIDSSEVKFLAACRSSCI